MSSSLANNGDPNFNQYVPGSDVNGNNGNGFEDWACENFNLLEFVGDDNKEPGFEFKEEPADFNLSEEDTKKDLLYSTWQYNEMIANDHDYRRQNGFINQASNGLSQLADHAYQQQQQSNYEQPPLDGTQRPSTSATMVQQPQHQQIKEEFPSYDPLFETSDIHRDQRSTSTTSGASTNASYPDIMHTGTYHYEPTIKPRKYRLKPEQEKANPMYRMKREKNNDAVRRSRDKAKRMQMEKDTRLAFLENEEIKNKRLIMQLEQRNQLLETQLIRMKQTCRCGAITGRQP